MTAENSITSDPASEETMESFMSGSDVTNTPATTEVVTEIKDQAAVVATENNDAATNADSSPDAQNDQKRDQVQARINKITAAKYAEKKRADALQAKLDEIQATSATKQNAAPELADFDYDESAFNQALIDYKVNQSVSKLEQSRIDSAKQATVDNDAAEFTARITAFGKDDFDTVASGIPELPEGVASALVSSEDGPALIYHIGTHLDLADSLAGMTTAQALMEIGKLTTKLNSQPSKTITPSGAPDPINHLSSPGGAITADVGDTNISMADWMAKFNP